MLTKNQIKLIHSLKQKKYRISHKMFVVEGVKVVGEFLNSKYELLEIFSYDKIYKKYDSNFTEVSSKELSKISNFTTANKVLAIFKIPSSLPVDWTGLVLVLDSINDPGNLGAIIRLCDWFGIDDLVCNETTVDCYNSKVVQSSMGSHTRVNISYLKLESVLAGFKPCYGAFMEGNSVYEQNLPEKGVIILGNEANGISKEIKALVDTRLSIPRFGVNKKTESLNVANAAAIILSEFKRSSTEK
ncbi:MAG: RNA methyltransferase [Flavobacteriaceae bacterium]|nr:RNA methyltransferase [Flavobacteriaceae bacterium]